MSTHTLSLVAHFCFGLLTGLAIMACILLPIYNRVYNKLDQANAVIEETINQYPTFFDTIGEGDTWNSFVNE